MKSELSKGVVTQFGDGRDIFEISHCGSIAAQHARAIVIGVAHATWPHTDGRLIEWNA